MAAKLNKKAALKTKNTPDLCKHQTNWVVLFWLTLTYTGNDFVDGTSGQEEVMQ